MNYIHAIREYATPIKNKSSLAETGRITPAEFVKTGDYLVYKCPTWSWSAGDPHKRREYLPTDKQYLVTRNVPCHPNTMGINHYSEEHVDDWTIYQDPTGHSKDPVDITTLEENEVAQSNKSTFFGNDSDEELLEFDEALVDSNIIRTRTYDLYITWDKFYQTPRVWLFGYNEDRIPLTRQEMFEDISTEHAHKTVTYDPHPHENYPCLSIHPCKHDHVMKKMMDQKMSSGEFRVEQYIILFLKFIGTVIPTITYDYSMSM
jgi:ubiquitin-like-conjugating enzyme ATG3